MATATGDKMKTRKELVRGARMGPYALWTAIVGTVVGGVTCAVLVAGTYTLLQQNDSTLDLSPAWDALGERNALVLGGLLFLSYLVATFVAGKMAWRRGWLHGLAAEIDLRDRIEKASHEQPAPVPVPADGDGDGKTRDELKDALQQR
jgi:hypothetical protein